jgi:hypothetical protein
MHFRDAHVALSARKTICPSALLIPHRVRVQLNAFDYSQPRKRHSSLSQTNLQGIMVLISQLPR